MEFDPIKLEILRMAKDVIIDEYINKKAEEHNKWLVESDHLWRTQRLRLGYPTIPPYPTELEIVQRAQLLFKFIISAKTQEVSKKEIIEEIKPPVSSIESGDKPTTIDYDINTKYPTISSETPMDEVIANTQSAPKDAILDVEVTKKEEEQSTINKLLKKIENLKGNWGINAQ
jgi:hypothetical protein